MSLVSSKQLEANRAELTVEVKGEKYHAAVENAFRARAAKITLPGFRKGKAPRAMIERAYGKGLFYEDAMNNLYPEAYSAAVEEAGIEPVESAQVEILEVNDEGFSFKAVVTTKPEVTLGEYMGVKAIRPVRETTDEEISQRLEAVRAEYARTVTVSDRPAQINDNTAIDFEGVVDGEAFEGGKGEHFSLTLGSGTFIPGFEDQIVGHAAGEEFDVRVTFPEDYAEKKLAGKEAVFKVKLNEIHERQLPDLDDEFAKDASEFDTLTNTKPTFGPK
jgi:trigger factor